LQQHITQLATQVAQLREEIFSELRERSSESQHRHGRTRDDRSCFPEPTIRAASQQRPMRERPAFRSVNRMGQARHNNANRRRQPSRQSGHQNASRQQQPLPGDAELGMDRIQQMLSSLESRNTRPPPAHEDLSFDALANLESRLTSRATQPSERPHEEYENIEESEDLEQISRQMPGLSRSMHAPGRR
jgi:hypothetical protein